MISRFFAGVFASAPLALAGGTISDIWDNDERGFAIALFAAAPYGGPVAGPIVGGFVGETICWRWIFWVNMIFAGVVSLMILTIPETDAVGPRIRHVPTDAGSKVKTILRHGMPRRSKFQSSTAYARQLCDTRFECAEGGSRDPSPRSRVGLIPPT